MQNHKFSEFIFEKMRTQIFTYFSLTVMPLYGGILKESVKITLGWEVK
jgi:hypothetical protein